MDRRSPQHPGQRGGFGRGGPPPLARMRHLKSGRHFNRDTKARKALMRNLCTDLIAHGRITTTEAKAKELRRWVERLITEAKADDLAARRRVAREISQDEVADKLFSNLMPRLRERPGGYTRIIRKGPRLRDAPPMVSIELVGRDDQVQDLDGAQ